MKEKVNVTGVPETMVWRKIADIIREGDDTDEEKTF